MITHPLLLATLVVDGLCLLLLVRAGLSALKLLLSWQPDTTTAQQLALERSAEDASLAGRMALALLAFSSLLLVMAVSGALPELVRGAMCGTGVLQAMQGEGERALVLRGLALAALLAWHLVDRLDRSHPRLLLVQQGSRLLLVAAPLTAVAVVLTARALVALDGYEPVSCCVAVYDRVVAGAGPGLLSGLSDAVWTTSSVALAGVLLVLGVWAWRGRQQRGWWAGLTAVVALVWLVVATIALTRVFASYHYGVLHHHCPWCLFLVDHRLVGYPLFGALGWVALEGGAMWLATRVRVWVPPLEVAARVRQQRAGLGLVVAVLIYLGLALVPALVWRLRFGVWMG